VPGRRPHVRWPGTRHLLLALLLVGCSDGPSTASSDATSSPLLAPRRRRPPRPRRRSAAIRSRTVVVPRRAGSWNLHNDGVHTVHHVFGAWMGQLGRPAGQPLVAAAWGAATTMRATTSGSISPLTEPGLTEIPALSSGGGQASQKSLDRLLGMPPACRQRAASHRRRRRMPT
jgi:hypothetical protein